MASVLLIRRIQPCWVREPDKAAEAWLTHLKGSERGQYVQEMFARIAPRYDLMNRLMTFGQDAGWRREVIRRAGLSGERRLLDLGAGTGDLAAEALRQCPGCQVIAADFTLGMIRLGQSRLVNTHMKWAAADAGCLPFPAGAFDAIVSGFLLRNVPDVSKSLDEQYRVLKSGGRIVTLDTTPPPRTVLAPIIRLHMHNVIPALGKLVAGNSEAYNYLPDSTEAFLEPEQLAARLIAAGFRNVGFLRRMFGTIAIHWGIK